MKAAARGCLLAAAIIIPALVLAVCWALLSAGDCSYRLAKQETSPSGRYVVELYGVDCGMASYETVLLIRNVHAPRWPNLDGRPAGTTIARQIDTRDRAVLIYWADETRLVIQHGSGRPELLRAAWGGVRIELRRS